MRTWVIALLLIPLWLYTAHANTPAVTRQPPASLDTTRWNIASHLYLLYFGDYREAETEACIDYAAGLGFNAIRFNVWWHEIYPDAASLQTGGQWYPLDHTIDYAISRGLKVIVTLSLRRPDRELIADEGDHWVRDHDGNSDTNWDSTARFSFSSPRFGQAIRFVQEVGERYAHHQNAGHILAISPLVTREAEIPYAHDTTEDSSRVFLEEFRAWLAGRYQHDINALNNAWETKAKAFDDIAPPRHFHGQAGQDWYLFRDLKARQFIDSCCAVLADIPGLTTAYRVLLDYGNVGDPMAWRRGSLTFAFHADNPLVWGVKQNDAHDYDQNYTGSLLGSGMARLGKVAINEWFHDRNPAKYPRKNILGDSYREIKGHYDQGMNGVSYVGVSPTNTQLETLITLLKTHGVWDAPVTPRRTDDVSTVHVPLSELLNLDGWALRNRYFKPNATGSPPQVNLLIDYDLSAEPLPLMLPAVQPR